MPAYVVIQRTSQVRDPAEYAEYQRKTRDLVGQFKLRPLVIQGAPEGLEGNTPPDGVVLLEFPTTEEAKAWYNSPGYQAALPHRLKSADYHSFIVEGIEIAQL